MESIFFAIKTVLKDQKYLLIFLLSSITFLALFIVIPLVTIPGNDLMFQLKIFRARDYFLMTLLAILVGLNLAIQFYTFKQRGAQNAVQSVAGGAISGVSGIFGAIVGTTACTSCLISLFGLIGLGAGSALFVLKNQTHFLIGAIIAMIILLYFTARKISNVCS